MSSDANKPEVKVFKFGKDNLSDVIFVVGGKEFHCHRMYLSFKSPYFAAMFTSGFKEKNEKRIEIKKTDAVAFKRLMQILYDSRIEDEFLPLCEKNQIRVLWTETCALFELADRFLVLDAVRHVVEMSFLVHDRRCYYSQQCSYCSTKLLLALRFKMVEYKELSKSRQRNVSAALESLNIEDDFICTATFLVNLA